MATKTREKAREGGRCSAICSQCGDRADGRVDKIGRKLKPHGWKGTVSGAVLCAACFSRRYRSPRAIIFTVVGPENGEWEDFREDLKTAWGNTRRLYNIVSQELAKTDGVRMPEDVDWQAFKKRVPNPAPGLYDFCTGRCPTMPASSVAAAIQAVSGKIGKSRFDRVWMGSRGPDSFRYPQPFPVKKGAWRALLLDGQRPAVECTLVRGGHRWCLRLRGGPGFRRQMASFRQLLSGEAEPATLELYRKPANAGDNRNGVREGGKLHHVMCKLVLRLPRTDKRRELMGRLMVRTMPDSLLVARVEGREKNGWWMHEDDLPRAVIAQDHRIRRLREDAKSAPSGRRRKILDKMHAVSEKAGRRMAARYQVVAVSLAKHASRVGVAELVYDDDDRTFTPHLNWSEIWRLVGDKLPDGCALTPIATIRKLKSRATLAADLTELFVQMKIEETKRHERSGDGTDGNRE